MPTNLLAYGDCGLLRASALILSASSRLRSCTVLALDMDHSSCNLRTTYRRLQDTQAIRPSTTPALRGLLFQRGAKHVLGVGVSLGFARHLRQVFEGLVQLPPPE